MEDRDGDEHNGCPLHLQSDISHALASKQSVLRSSSKIITTLCILDKTLSWLCFHQRAHGCAAPKLTELPTIWELILTPCSSSSTCHRLLETADMKNGTTLNLVQATLVGMGCNPACTANPATRKRSQTHDTGYRTSQLALRALATQAKQPQLRLTLVNLY